MKRFVLLGICLIAATVGAWYGFRSTSEAATGFRLVTVERGTVEKTVTATGTLEPRTTVEVGTQVSGQISEILVDFNDPVTTGQVIARIDPQNLDMTVAQSKVAVRKASADLANAQRDASRIEELHSKDLAAEVDLTDARYKLEIAQSSLEAAEIDLERAEQNLEYATIRAPMSGIVVERLVDVGQTVAASLSAPQLFLIAADLSEMRILATVDESDVGEIAEEQNVRFRVQAYPEDSFSGVVRQIRLQPTYQDNVVSYTVVVEVQNENEETPLLPGMTATVDFLVDTAEDVLTIPNAALRFRPSEELVAEARANSQTEERMGYGPDGGAPGTAPPESGAETSQILGGDRTRSETTEKAVLFYIGEDGSTRLTPVIVGLSDGESTEIASRTLEEDMSVIAGSLVASSSASNSNSSPFNQTSNSGQRGGPPPAGGF